MNQTLLAYEIDTPGTVQPFTFCVPRITQESLRGASLVDGTLTIWLLADAKTPTREYIGRIYAVNEPFQRPKLCAQITVPRTRTETPGGDADFDADGNRLRVPKNDRVILIIEPTSEDAQREVLQHLREELGPFGHLLPTELLEMIAKAALAAKDEPEQ